MRRKKRIHSSTKATFTYKLLPIMAVIGLLPLTVRAKLMAFDVSMIHQYAQDTHQMFDIFNYYKAALLITSAVIMLIVVAYLLMDRKLTLHHRLYSPVYAYCALVLLSTLFSTSLYYSNKGFINHLESFWVLLAYMAVFVYTALIVDRKKSIQQIVDIWMVSIGLLTLIGLTQFLRHDLYQTDLGLALIVPGSLRQFVDNVEFSLFADNVIYQSLFHYNYVSFYSAMAMPFFVSLFIDTKDYKRRILYAVVSLAILFNLLGAQGRNGLVGLAFGLLIIFFFHLKKLLRSKIAWISSAVLLLLLILTATFTETSFEQRIKLAFTNFNTDAEYVLKGITTEDGKVVISHRDYGLVISSHMENEQLNFTFTDLEGSELLLLKGTDGFTLEDPSGGGDYTDFSGALMDYNGQDVISTTINGRNWHFIWSDGELLYLNEFGKIEQLEPIPAIGFEGNERMGSARGYIWSRSLPIILRNPLFGTGPDTFALSFPQHDYVGKWHAYEYYTPFVDKPHNILINYAINTGIPSLLAILAIIAIGYWQTIRNFATAHLSSPLRPYAIASIGAVTGYLGAGMFNDTSLHVTPVFWVIMGLNYAVNRMVHSEKA